MSAPTLMYRTGTSITVSCFEITSVSARTLTFISKEGARPSCARKKNRFFQWHERLDDAKTHLIEREKTRIRLLKNQIAVCRQRIEEIEKQEDPAIAVLEARSRRTKKRRVLGD